MCRTHLSYRQDTMETFVRQKSLDIKPHVHKGSFSFCFEDARSLKLLHRITLRSNRSASCTCKCSRTMCFFFEGESERHTVAVCSISSFKSAWIAPICVFRCSRFAFRGLAVLLSIDFSSPRTKLREGADVEAVSRLCLYQDLPHHHLSWEIDIPILLRVIWFRNGLTEEPLICLSHFFRRSWHGFASLNTSPIMTCPIRNRPPFLLLSQNSMSWCLPISFAKRRYEVSKI